MPDFYSPYFLFVTYFVTVFSCSLGLFPSDYIHNAAGHARNLDALPATSATQMDEVNDEKNSGTIRLYIQATWQPILLRPMVGKRSGARRDHQEKKQVRRKFFTAVWVGQKPEDSGTAVHLTLLCGDYGQARRKEITSVLDFAGGGARRVQEKIVKPICRVQKYFHMAK